MLKDHKAIRLITGQVLALALVLCTFALFHHVIPYIRESEQHVPSVEPAAVRSSISASDAETVTKPVQPDVFSEIVTRTDTSYEGPHLRIQINTYAETETYPNLTYYVADVYVSDISCLCRAYPAKGSFGSGTGIVSDNSAVFGINGDSVSPNYAGVSVVAGKILQNVPNKLDICVLYADGRMETCSPGTYNVESLVLDGAYHIWNFGPSLLDENGDPLSSFNAPREISGKHPRTAIGYYEPGHYCFVVIDGRQKHSVGADLHTLASIMSDLGCTVAYNLDGGASSVMVFDGQNVNIPCKTRYIRDMIVLIDPEDTEVSNETA